MELENLEEYRARLSAIRLVSGCIKNCGNKIWLGEYEDDITRILKTWLVSCGDPTDPDYQWAKDIYDRIIKKENDLRAEVSRRERIEKEQEERK